LFFVTLTFDLNLHDPKSIGFFVYCRILSLKLIMIARFLSELWYRNLISILVSVTFDLDLHDPKSIGFFLSLQAGNMPCLELIVWFISELWRINQM